MKKLLNFILDCIFYERVLIREAKKEYKNYEKLEREYSEKLTASNTANVRKYNKLLEEVRSKYEPICTKLGRDLLGKKRHDG